MPDSRSSVDKKWYTASDRYKPLANRTYEALAEHYGCAILPARPGKPQDKA